MSLRINDTECEEVCVTDLKECDVPMIKDESDFIAELLVILWITAIILIRCSSFLTPISKYSFINGTINVASPISFTNGFNSEINSEICLVN